MTDKEIEIQKMARVVCNRHFAGYNLDCKKECNAKCDCGRIAEDLYKAGYRKAGNVRKETAETILQDFYDQTFEMKDPYNGDVDEQKEVIDRGDILNMAEYFKVKVDE